MGPQEEGTFITPEPPPKPVEYVVFPNRLGDASLKLNDACGRRR